MINKKLLTCLLIASLLSGGMHALSIKEVLQAMQRFEPVYGTCTIKTFENGGQDISLERANITEFTEGDVVFLADHFPHLTHLNLDGNKVTSVPHNISLLTQLKFLLFLSSPISDFARAVVAKQLPGVVVL